MTTSLKTLLSGIVDYAGLFPPAGLGMADAVRNHASYRCGEHSWMLGRFIVPANRLEEFEAATENIMARTDTIPIWRLSLLASPASDDSVEKVVEFNKRQLVKTPPGRVLIDTIEVKASTPAEIKKAMARVHGTLMVYCEIPIDKDPVRLIAEIAKRGARAKVRTGGVTADAFPSEKNLLRFIRRCADAFVLFKATAGLHHPVCATYPLTYEPDSPRGRMFGFLNLFLAAAYVRNGMKDDQALQLLTEKSPEEFHFDDVGVIWRSHRLSNEALQDERRSFSISFGSCSFTEPIEDLKRLKLL